MALESNGLPVPLLAVSTAVGHRDGVVPPWRKVECSRWSQEVIAPTVACRSLGGAGLLMAYGRSKVRSSILGSNYCCVKGCIMAGNGRDCRQDLPSQEIIGAEIIDIDNYDCIELL